MIATIKPPATTLANVVQNCAGLKYCIAQKFNGLDACLRSAGATGCYLSPVLISLIVFNALVGTVAVIEDYR